MDELEKKQDNLSGEMIDRDGVGTHKMRKTFGYHYGEYLCNHHQ